MRVAVVIITYNRVKDAKVQMELIRNLWSKQKQLRSVTIYHLYDGKEKWYPKKYLEDFFIKCKNPGHYEGAGLLINTGIETVLNSKTRFDYIIVSSADVWLIKPKLLVKILEEMGKKKYFLAASTWFSQEAFSTEFFIISSQFAKYVFPLESNDYRVKHWLLTFFTEKIAQKAVLEICLWKKVDKTLKRLGVDKEKEILRLPFRQNIIRSNRFHSPELGYLSHHNPRKKRKIVIKAKLEKYTPSLF